MKRKLSILHLSDLHITKRGLNLSKIFNHGRCADSDVLDAIADEINKLRDSIDCIVVTGDLADSGKEKYLREAFDYLFSPIKYPPYYSDMGKFPTIDGLNKNIFTIPGNHDRFSNILNPSPINSFEMIFQPSWKGDAYSVDAFELNNNHNAQPDLVIVGVDFSLRDKFKIIPFDYDRYRMVYGTGRVYEDLIVKLEYETLKYINKCPIIWAMHFAPSFESIFPGEIKDFLKLSGSNDIISLAEELGVHYILCGHTHKCAKYNVRSDDKINVLCSGSSSCIVSGEHTSFHLYNITIDNNKIINFEYNDYLWNGRSFNIANTNNSCCLTL